MLCEILNNTFNKSAETGIIPEDWKSANVTNRRELGIYRAISLTSVVCKTMERFIKLQINTNLEGSNLICDSQLGFRKKRSCLIIRLDFFARVIDTDDVDNNKAVDLIYPDV